MDMKKVEQLVESSRVGGGWLIGPDQFLAKLAAFTPAEPPLTVDKPCLCGDNPRPQDCMAAATDGLLAPGYFCRRQLPSTESK